LISLEEKFYKLGVKNAPGQEEKSNRNIDNKNLLVDFSHGDVDAFKPIPKSLEKFIEGFHMGEKQAYTEYKGKEAIRSYISQKISCFTNTQINADKNIIVSPGTQGALFLAMGSTISRGDKVAIVEPDYFANRKIAEFFEANIIPIDLEYYSTTTNAGVNLNQLEQAFKNGVKLFLFSNPNNPTGIIYSSVEIKAIAKLAQKYNVTIIVDQLYSRQVFDEREYTHLCAQQEIDPENIISIMGPSKTESLSGYRLGIAFGSSKIINRMEKLQAIVSLRASGYNQAVLNLWFSEPEGWLEERIIEHQLIRDDLVSKFKEYDDLFNIRSTEAGSYLFPQITMLNTTIHDFVDKLRIQENIIVTPGTEFGKQFKNSFRLNFSQDHQSAVNAIERLIELAKEHSK